MRVVAASRVIWTHLYRGVRVFGTTIGHHNETMEGEVFLDTVSRGLLWAVGRLAPAGRPLTGYRVAGR